MNAARSVPGHWVLAVMRAIQPHAPPLILNTYPETAEAIAEAATNDPLFPGEDGPVRTAAVLVAIAFYESNFDRTAIGDHGKSFGLFQISGAHVPGLVANVLLVPREAAPVAIKLIRTSLRVCGEFPWNERLGWFGAGGVGCKEAGRRVTRSRMFLAEKILKDETMKMLIAKNEAEEEAP